jgi:2-dehydropantoate 2-reductase
MIEFNKACVVGAGAIGGWLADGLARQGCQVSMLARGATLAALQRDGLRVLKKQANDSEKTEQTVESRQAVEAFNDVNVVGVQDVVVLALKAPALRAVLPSLRPLLGPNTVVLTAMNGVPWWFTHGLGGPLDGATLASVDPGGELARAVPAHHVLGCVVHASCSVEAPGVVRHHFGNGLILGEPTGGTSERVEALAALLVRAGFAATVSPRIQKDIWFKLWGNMTVNPVSALTGATTDLILGDPLVRDFVSAVMLEAKAIGERIGLPIDQQPTDRHAVTLKLGAFKTSMLQDVEAGKPVELDALVAAVREMGHLVAVHTPFTDALLGLARLQAQVKGLI